VVNTQERIFNQILDVIEHPSFIERTYIASDYQLVAELIRRTPEVKFLVKYKDTSFPFFLAHYQEEKENMTHASYLIYFMIFGTYQNTAAIPELISYLISCRVGLGKGAPHFFHGIPFFTQQKHLQSLLTTRFQFLHKKKL